AIARFSSERRLEWKTFEERTEDYGRCDRDCLPLAPNRAPTELLRPACSQRGSGGSRPAPSLLRLSASDWIRGPPQPAPAWAAPPRPATKRGPCLAPLSRWFSQPQICRKY